MADVTIQSLTDQLCQKAIDLAAEHSQSPNDGLRRYTASMAADAVQIRSMIAAAPATPDAAGASARYHAEVDRLHAEELKLHADRATAAQQEQQAKADESVAKAKASGPAPKP